MFTSATGYIFSFGLSRRRHDPPFKPGGSVGALVGRPGFRAGFARTRARGRGRGSVGQHAAAGKSLWIAICNPATISLVCVCSLSHGRLPARPPRVSPTVRVHRHGLREKKSDLSKRQAPSALPKAPIGSSRQLQLLLSRHSSVTAGLAGSALFKDVGDTLEGDGEQGAGDGDLQEAHASL